MKLRRKHIEHLCALFDDLGWDADQRRAFFADNLDKLSFITGLEHALGLDLHALTERPYLAESR